MMPTWIMRVAACLALLLTLAPWSAFADSLPAGQIVGPDASYGGGYDVVFQVPNGLVPQDVVTVLRGGAPIGEATVVDVLGDVEVVIVPISVEPLPGDLIVFARHAVAVAPYSYGYRYDYSYPYDYGTIDPYGCAYPYASYPGIFISFGGHWRFRHHHDYDCWRASRGTWNASAPGGTWSGRVHDGGTWNARTPGTWNATSPGVSRDTWHGRPSATPRDAPPVGTFHTPEVHTGAPSRSHERSEGSGWFRGDRHRR